MITNRAMLMAGLVLFALTFIAVNVMRYYKTKPLREKFIHETNYDTYLENKMQKFSQRLIALGKMKQSEKQNQKLTFVFNTNNMEKVTQLENEIRAHFYPSVRHGGDVPNATLFLITGETNSMTISDTAVETWIAKMCQVGYQFDCEFMNWSIESENN